MAVPYERAVEEATQAFLKVMDLRGFGRKDDYSDFQRQLMQATEYSFHSLSGGPDTDADTLVAAILRVNEEPIRSCIVHST